MPRLRNFFFLMIPQISTFLAIVIASATIVSPAWAGDAADYRDSGANSPDGASAVKPPGDLSSTDVLANRQRALAAVADGLDDATDAAPGTHRRLPDPGDPGEVLNSNTSFDDSLSVGTVRDGRLKNAAELAHVGPYHQVIEPHRQRNTHYGTAELIEAIETGAAEVAEHHGGAPLRVGNLAYPRGGPIPWSGSHQAGRDADIAFYSLDDQGRSVPTPGLVEFDDDGRAIGHDLYFDVQRNWALARSLLTNPDINVVWLFVSEGLKRLMLKHAIEIDEPWPLIERAASILHQPTDAPPHADHFHLRIGCPETDRLNGCVDWGPQWEWYDWHHDALFARTRTLRRAFDDGDAELRRRAVEHLHDIRAPLGPEIALGYGLADPDSDVRAAALELIDELPVRSNYGLRLLAHALDDTAAVDDEQTETLYAALRRAHPAEAADIAVELAHDTDRADAERQLALRALDHRLKPHIVPELTRLIRDDHTNSRLRQQAARQIRRITAHAHGLDWSEPVDDAHLQALDDWDQLSRSIADTDDRRQLLVDMLADYGVDEWNDLEAVDELIPLLANGADYKRYNLNLVLSEWTGRWVSPEWGNSRRAYRFWSRWWDRNRDRQLDDTTYPWE